MHALETRGILDKGHTLGLAGSLHEHIVSRIRAEDEAAVGRAERKIQNTAPAPVAWRHRCATEITCFRATKYRGHDWLTA